MQTEGSGDTITCGQTCFRSCQNHLATATIAQSPNPTISQRWSFTSSTPPTACCQQWLVIWLFVGFFVTITITTNQSFRSGLTTQGQLQPPSSSLPLPSASCFAWLHTGQDPFLRASATSCCTCNATDRFSRIGRLPWRCFDRDTPIRSQARRRQ